jgi:hypothetical protein
MVSVDESLKSMFMSIAAKAYYTASFTNVYKEVTTSQLVLTLGVIMLILLLSWLSFEYMAQHEPTWYLYRQRLHHRECAAYPQMAHRDAVTDITRFKSTLVGAFSIDDSHLPGIMGTGGYLSYRVLRHCAYFSLISVLYASTVLFPVYISQRGHSGRGKTMLEMIVVNNISDTNPSHTWVIVISAYLVCFYWCVLLFSEWQIVMQAIRNASQSRQWIAITILSSDREANH